MRSFFVLALLGVLLVAVAIVVRTGVFSRQDPGRPLNAAMRSSMGGLELSPDDAAQVESLFPGAVKTESGLRTVLRQEGQGPTPFKGQVVTLHYTGRFLNGEKFDSSLDHGGPFNFQVGLGRVIVGWDEAVGSMRKGERRTLIVPYWLAYGEKGRGKIPARATLVFDVEILDIR